MDNRDHDQERRDITGALALALLLFAVATCIGCCMWWTYPTG